MRDDFNAPALMDVETQNAIQQVIDDHDSSFAHLVKVLGLRAEADFRYIDLAGVDFSGADLRGYDFTGANLRSAIGLNVQLDATTVLTDADLDRSIFAYTVDRDKFFDEHPELEKEYKMISGLYFLDQPSFLYEAAKNRIHRSKYKAFCKRLFEESSNATVLTNMLLTLGMLEDERRSHIEFLLSICGAGNRDRKERLALRQLADIFRDDHAVFQTLLLYSSSPDNSFRETAIIGVIKSKLFISALARIRSEIIRSSTSTMRRAFTARICQLCGEVFPLCAYDFYLRRYIDFADELDYRNVIASSQKLRTLENYSHLYEIDAEEFILDKIDLLRKRLLPLKLSARVEKEIKKLRIREEERKLRDKALRSGIKPHMGREDASD